MPAQPLTDEQKADAERLQSLFKGWQKKRRSEGKSFSQTEAAELLGLGFGQSAFSQYLRGEIPLNVRTVAGCAILFGCQPEEISPSLAADLHALASATDTHISVDADKPKKSQNSGMIEGSQLPTGATLGEQDLPNPTADEYVLVPLLDVEAACGEGRFHDHVIVDGGRTFAKSELRDLGVPEYAARLIYAAGGSMSPKIQDGRAVLINLMDREPRDGKIYAICKPDDGLVLKRLIWDFHPAVGQQTWIIRSDNADKTTFPDKLLPPDDRTMIIGRAVWTDSLL
ncbi:LexA family transcriptional regulator [Paraburkholderia sediminicola]|uniref:LexA family transcriptional regulator n=1 Tax=Paraburkholderia sediminicola TaxID=458836 RepID=UPI0038B9D636